jgi:hypothetical protein
MITNPGNKHHVEIMGFTDGTGPGPLNDFTDMLK